jgi:uncharacterized membrane protein YkvA (DUF1232 family)
MLDDRREGAPKPLRRTVGTPDRAHTGGMWWKFLKAVKDRQHRVAPTTWIAAIAAVVYTLMPIDLIPELVLGPLGFVDDIGLWGIFAVLFAREQQRWISGRGAK